MHKFCKTSEIGKIAIFHKIAKIEKFPMHKFSKNVESFQKNYKLLKLQIYAKKFQCTNFQKILKISEIALITCGHGSKRNFSLVCIPIPWHLSTKIFDEISLQEKTPKLLIVV